MMGSVLAYFSTARMQEVRNGIVGLRPGVSISSGNWDWLSDPVSVSADDYAAAIPECARHTRVRGGEISQHDIAPNGVQRDKPRSPAEIPRRYQREPYS